MWIALYILILAVSFLVIPINILDRFWLPKEAAFNILGFTVIALSWMNSRDKTRKLFNKWLGLILIYAVISFGWFFYAPLIFNSLNTKIVWNVWNFRPTLNLILALFLIQALVENTISLIKWVEIAELLCWIAFGFSVYAILQYLNLDQIFGGYKIHYTNGIIEPKVRMMTFIGQHTLTAGFLSAISPLCLIFKKLRYKVFYFFILIAVILANSVLSTLAFTMGLLAYLFFTKKLKWAFFILFLSLAGAIFMLYKDDSFFSFSGRLEIWKSALVGVKDRIITGNGLGSFAMSKLTFGLDKRIALSAHCEPLQILFEGGLIMLTLVLGYLVSLFRKIWHANNSILLYGYTAAFVSFLVISMGSFSFRIAPLALLGILYISALEVQTQGEANGR